MKFLWLLLFAVVIWRLASGRWPFSGWGKAMFGREPRGATMRSAEAERARILLGVPQGAGRQHIMEAHRRLVAAVHPDRGGTSDMVVEANAARDTLLADIETLDQGKA